MKKKKNTKETTSKRESLSSIPAENPKKAQNKLNTIKEDYRRFLSSHRGVFDSHKREFALKNLDVLMHLHFLVNQQREGFFETVKRNAFRQVFKEFEKTYSNSGVLTAENIEAIYKDYLFRFDYEEDGNKNYDPDLIAKPIRITVEDYNSSQKLRMSQEQFFGKLFLNDTPILIEGFCGLFGLKDELFDLKFLEKNYGNLKVDAIHQKSSKFIEGLGFDVKHENMAQDIEEDIPFADFIAGSSKLEKNISKIANNIDLQDWQAVYKELNSKIPETLRFSSPGDWISFLRQDVRGITQPQFNIQLKGSWIGGHQEPLGLKGVYINHGPGGNEWFGVQRSELPKIEKLLLEKHGLNIYKSEGLWFGDQHFLRENGIPVVNFVQNKGDLVIVNRGLVYWIKSLGVSVNSGWNLVGNDLSQIPLMLKRFEFNRDHEMENIINVRTWCLDLLLNLAGTGGLSGQDNASEDFLALVNAVDGFHKEEERLRTESSVVLGGKKYQPEINEAIPAGECDNCSREIFNYFVRLSSSPNKSQTTILCLQCYKSEIKNTDPKLTEHFMNYPPESLLSLLKRTSGLLQSKKRKESLSFSREIREDSLKLVRIGYLNQEASKLVIEEEAGKKAPVKAAKAPRSEKKPVDRKKRSRKAADIEEIEEEESPLAVKPKKKVKGLSEKEPNIIKPSQKPAKPILKEIKGEKKPERMIIEEEEKAPEKRRLRPKKLRPDPAEEEEVNEETLYEIKETEKRASSLSKTPKPLSRPAKFKPGRPETKGMPEAVAQNPKKSQSLQMEPEDQPQKPSSKKTYSQQEQELYIEKISKKTGQQRFANEVSGDSININNINNIQNNFSINNNQNFFSFGEDGKADPSDLKNIILTAIPKIISDSNSNSLNNPSGVTVNETSKGGTAVAGVGLSQLSRLVQENGSVGNNSKDGEENQRVHAVLTENDIIQIKELKEIVSALEKLPTLTAYQMTRLNSKVSHLIGFPLEQLTKNEDFIELVRIHGQMRTGSILKSCLSPLAEKNN